ncbi:phosphate signaling complex protein PhoU [uncultured Sphingomonas sp.]|uniref:phosphate signaling complex protein PhoU n=1 Tax=uncultured Sphingomonas sp. TaxID=158754 RepID=UPI0035CC13D4
MATGIGLQNGIGPERGVPPSDDIRRLRGLVAQMGGLAEQAIAEAMTALSRGDTELATSIRAADRRIDAMAAEVERAVVRILARGVPGGIDLREAIAALKIAAVIERIADYAKNIAKRVPLIATDARLRPPDAFPSMGRMAGEMVRDALDAFAARDPASAAEVCRRDQALDEVHAGVFRTLVEHMAANPATVEQAAHLLFVAKNLERIGDHATNLAEMVYFAATGEQMTDRQRGAAAG